MTSLGINKLFEKLKKIDLKEFSLLYDKKRTLKSCHDLLYQANILVFQSSTINHKKRLSILKKLKQISIEYKLPFCTAHNLTLSIKVSKELGLLKNLIKDSHKSIELWKSVLDNPLAINGLVFSYTDLGLIFSDNNLNSLAIKYLEKAESLISECENEYNPFIKLYVAYAVVYSKMKEYKKTKDCYDKVIKASEAKKDSLTLIPILVNSVENFIFKKEYNKAMIQCKKALKISNENSDNIYKPHISLALGQIYFELNKYKESNKFFKESLAGFENMNTIKMIPQVLYNIGKVHYKKREYDKAASIFNNILEKNKKINNFDLKIKVQKKLSMIYEKNNDRLYLISVKNLNKLLEEQIKNKEKIFSDTNITTLKYLSKEFSLSLKKKENLRFKFDLESKKRELTTEALISYSEREFLKNIIQELSNDQMTKKKIIQLCKERMKHTKDWNIFMKLFNDIHPDFNKYIISKCPIITESELRVCNLIKMSFSSLEIAEILSISKRGIEQHRYRIRKKLGLLTDLTIFIQSL